MGLNFLLTNIVEVVVANNSIPWQFPKIRLGLENVGPVCIPCRVIDTGNSIWVVEIVSTAKDKVDLLASCYLLHFLSNC